MCVNYTTHRFHFLSSQSLSCTPINSIPPLLLSFPSEQNCQPNSLTWLCRTPALCSSCPSTKWNCLSFSSSFQRRENSRTIVKNTAYV